MTTKTKRRQARTNLDEVTWDRIERVSKRDGLKPSEIFKLAIIEYLRRDESRYGTEMEDDEDQNGVIPMNDYR